MRRYYCDRCGKELPEEKSDRETFTSQEEKPFSVVVSSKRWYTGAGWSPADLCPTCIVMVIHKSKED